MTDKPTQELKPCPFCGGADIHAGRGSPVRPIMCKTCGATASDATAWNQRSGDATELLRKIENYQVPRDWTTDAWGGGASVKKEILSIVRAHLEGEA